MNFELWEKSEKILTIFLENFMKYIYIKEVYYILLEILHNLNNLKNSLIEKSQLTLLHYFNNDDFFRSIKKEYLFQIEKFI